MVLDSAEEAGGIGGEDGLEVAGAGAEGAVVGETAAGEAVGRVPAHVVYCFIVGVERWRECTRTDESGKLCGRLDQAFYQSFSFQGIRRCVFLKESLGCVVRSGG